MKGSKARKGRDQERRGEERRTRNEVRREGKVQINGIKGEQRRGDKDRRGEERGEEVKAGKEKDKKNLAEKKRRVK